MENRTASSMVINYSINLDDVTPLPEKEMDQASFLPICDVDGIDLPNSTLENLLFLWDPEGLCTASNTGLPNDATNF